MLLTKSGDDDRNDTENVTKQRVPNVVIVAVSNYTQIDFFFKIIICFG